MAMEEKKDVSKWTVSLLKQFCGEYGLKKRGKRKILFYGTFVLCFGAGRQLQYHDLSSGPAVVLAAVKGAALRQGARRRQASSAP